MTYRLGFEHKLYRLTSGTRAAWPGTGAPTNLDEVPNCVDIDIDDSQTDVDATTRINGGFKVSLGGLQEVSFEFEMNTDPSDADWVALKTAYNARTSLAIAILDGDKMTVGTEGFWADMRILKFGRTQPLDGVARTKVMIKPGPSAVAPAWIVVA